MVVYQGVVTVDFNDECIGWESELYPGDEGIARNFIFSHCGYGTYCLETTGTIGMNFYGAIFFVTSWLGIIGLVAAKDAADPDRTKILSWLSLGSGVAVFLLIFLVIAANIAIIIFAVLSDNGGY